MHVFTLHDYTYTLLARDAQWRADARGNQGRHELRCSSHIPKLEKCIKAFAVYVRAHDEEIITSVFIGMTFTFLHMTSSYCCTRYGCNERIILEMSVEPRFIAVILFVESNDDDESISWLCPIISMQCSIWRNGVIVIADANSDAPICSNSMLIHQIFTIYWRANSSAMTKIFHQFDRCATSDLDVLSKKILVSIRHNFVLMLKINCIVCDSFELRLLMLCPKTCTILLK